MSDETPACDIEDDAGHWNILAKYMRPPLHNLCSTNAGYDGHILSHRARSIKLRNALTSCSAVQFSLYTVPALQTLYNEVFLINYSIKIPPSALCATCSR